MRSSAIRASAESSWASTDTARMEESPMGRLDDKVAIVTGAAQGVCRNVGVVGST
jgi:hypothetical protein